jgi:hypothetical protein
MPRTRTLLVLSAIVLATSPASAQQKFPPDKFVNLQVMPKDAPPGVVIAAMKNFTRGLGVRCDFCHVGEDGMALDTFDFVSDAKPQKNSARMMMRMAAEINQHITKMNPQPVEGQEVSCFTCHRGQTKPKHAP